MALQMFTDIKSYLICALKLFLSARSLHHLGSSIPLVHSSLATLSLDRAEQESHEVRHG